MTTDHSSAVGRSCPNDEFLVAAVTGSVSDDEQHWLDAHLDVCDRCLDATGALLQRLHIADEVAAPVPAAVHQRAAIAAALPDPATAILPGPQPATHRLSTSPPAPSWRTPGWMAGVRGWAAALLRPPVMIPAAVGLVAVFVVATQTWVAPGAPRSMTRSVVVPQHVRVTALEAAVRRQPNGHADVVATVTRGTPVTISGEERDWSHVTLPNGTEGWVDQGALR